MGRLRACFLAACLLAGALVATFVAGGTLRAQPAEPPEPAPEEPLTPVCLTAFDEAQRLRLAGKLLEARERLLACGQQDCPDVVRSKCVEWRGEIDRNVPSIVIAARDANGADLVHVKLYVDGKLVAEKLDGTALEVDPGLHELKVVHNKRQRRESIVVQQGEKNRLVRLAFEKPPPAKKSKRQRPKPRPEEDEGGFEMPVLGWIGFSMGAAALAVGAVTGSVALVKGDELESRCTEGVCHPPDKTDLEGGLAVAHVSTISFAVAGAGVVLGVIGVVVSDTGDKAKKPKTGVRVGPSSLEVWW